MEIGLKESIKLSFFLGRIREKMKKKIYVTIMPPLLPLKFVDMAAPDCFWAKHFIAILSDGRTSICGFGNWKFKEIDGGNIFDYWQKGKSLEDIWQNEFKSQ